MTQDGTPERKRRRRSYTMSSKALEQRRRAALKHGGRARGAISRGAGLSRAEKRAFDRAIEGLERAISRGDRNELEPVVIEALAPLYVLLGIEASELLQERLVVTERVLTGKTELVQTGKRAPDGSVEVVEQEIVLERCRPNPRAKLVLELAKLLGIDAREQGTTPRSSTHEAGSDTELEAHWERMREMERATEVEEP